MRTVLKYAVPEGELPMEFKHTVPDQPQLVHFEHDAEGHLSVWAEVETDSPPTEYSLFLARTGDAIPNNMLWLRSCVSGDDALHLYLVISPEAMAGLDIEMVPQTAEGSTSH